MSDGTVKIVDLNEVANSENYRGKKNPTDATPSNFLHAHWVECKINGTYVNYSNLTANGGDKLTYNAETSLWEKSDGNPNLGVLNGDLDADGHRILKSPTINDIEFQISDFTSIEGVEEASAGLYRYSNGTLMAIAGWLSKMFPIDPSVDNYITTKVSGAVSTMACYYTSEGVFISSENQGTDGQTDTYVRELLTVPPTAAFIGITNFSSTEYGVLETKNLAGVSQSELLAVENRVDINEIDIATNENDIATNENDISTNASNIAGILGEANDFTSVEGVEEASAGLYRYSNGTLMAIAGWLSKMFPIDPSVDNYITTKVSGAVSTMACYYTSEGVFISSENQGTDGQTDTYVRELLTVPPTAAFIGITNFSSTEYGTLEEMVFNPTTKTTTEILIAEKVNISLPTNFKGKKIAWFGTSIPAQGYPEIIGTQLEATVYNEAVGSSMARGFMYTGLKVGLNYQNCLKALSHTIAEKQHLMDNWITNLDSDGLTAGEGGTAPFTFGWRDLLTGTPPADWATYADAWSILHWSYENLLVAQYLDETDPDFVSLCDYFIFEHGHNDLVTTTYDLDDASAIAKTTSKDRATFISSMNYLIDVILSYNPRAKIIIIGHYESDRKERIYQAQENLFELWNFPSLKLWEYLGFSQMETETTGYWTDEDTWNDSGGPLVTKTMTEIWLYDDLHPVSGPAKEHIANIISKFLFNKL